MFHGIAAYEYDDVRSMQLCGLLVHDNVIKRRDFHRGEAVGPAALLFDCVDEFGRLGARTSDEYANVLQWAISHS